MQQLGFLFIVVQRDTLLARENILSAGHVTYQGLSQSRRPLEIRQMTLMEWIKATIYEDTYSAQIRKASPCQWC
jgi:hypothetical protein